MQIWEIGYLEVLWGRAEERIESLWLAQSLICQQALQTHQHTELKSSSTLFSWYHELKRRSLSTELAEWFPTFLSLISTPYAVLLASFSARFRVWTVCMFTWRKALSWVLLLSKNFWSMDLKGSLLSDGSWSFFNDGKHWGGQTHRDSNVISQ